MKVVRLAILIMASALGISSFAQDMENPGYSDAEKKILTEGKAVLPEGVDRADVKAHVDSVEAFAAKIGGFKKDLSMDRARDMFPWENVRLSLLLYPEEVKFGCGKCPDCGGTAVRILYNSPMVSWSMLAGWKGYFDICPACKTQFNYQVIMLN